MEWKHFAMALGILGFGFYLSDSKTNSCCSKTKKQSTQNEKEVPKASPKANRQESPIKKQRKRETN